MKRKWTDLTDEEKESAKERYMQYDSISKIADEIGVSRTTVQYHASNYWHPERELRRAELFAAFDASKKKQLVEISQDSIKVLSKALRDLATRDTPPTPMEARSVVSILEALDKITRLDDGKPTDISEEKIMDLTEIHTITSLVPFKKENQNEVSSTDSEDDDEDSNKLN